MNSQNESKARRRPVSWGVVGVVILAMVFSGLCPVVEAGDDFHQIKTEHYVVQTDISQHFTKLVGQHMEEIYHEYQRRFREYDLKSHERFRVRVYKHKRDYDGIIPSELKGSAGIFMSRDKMLAAYRGDRTPQRVFETLYHEGFHQFLYSCIRADVPLWVNEGFAEYFSESVWNGKRFVTGNVPARRLRTLEKAASEGRLLSFKKLFLMKSGKWMANIRKGEASVQYTQAWSVIHFLCHARGGRYRHRLLRYIKMISEGSSRQEAFRKCFGNNPQTFEQAWLKYVKNLKPSALSRCRSNLRLLMLLGQKMMNSPRNFTSLDALKGKLLSDRIRWNIETGAGRKVGSSDKESIRRLFKCPRDGSDATHSYLLIKSPQNNLPELYCIHHPGNVMRGYYEPADGGYKPRVERVVRETLPDSVVRILKRKIRKRRSRRQ